MFTKTDLKKILNSEEKALHMKDANKSMVLGKIKQSFKKRDFQNYFIPIRNFLFL